MTNHPNRSLDTFDRIVRTLGAAERAHKSALRDLRKAEQLEKQTDPETEGCVNQDLKEPHADAVSALSNARHVALLAERAVHAARAALTAARALLCEIGEDA